MVPGPPAFMPLQPDPADARVRGENDGPIVRPVYPSPDTPQYRGRVDARVSELDLAQPSGSAQGYVWTSLLNMVDYTSMSFAEHYLLGRSEQPYFARTSGWELQFWEPTTDNVKILMDRAHPIGSLDLRTVMHVEAFKVRHKFYQVNLGMPEGSFCFHVQTREEADMWAQCASQALVDFTLIKRAKWQEGLERAQSTVSRVVQARPRADRGDEDDAPRYEVDPGREEGLRGIWIQCLRAVGDGGAPPPQAFADLFALYNADRDEDLDQGELELMIRELVAVRRTELQRALAIQRGQVVTPARIMLNPDALVVWGKTVGEPGDKLLKSYDSMLQQRGFESRAVLLRSSLDTSHDGQVNLGEFVRGAPQFLLPQQELFREVQFYRACKDMKREFLEEHEKEEPGCLQQ